METFSVEDWELARSNIITWGSDLSSAPPTTEIRAIRQRIYDLGKRIDDLTLPPVQYEDSNPPIDDAQDDEPPSIPEHQEGEEEDVEIPKIDPKYVENETT